MSYGPFAADLDHAERVARCRALRTVAVLVLGRQHPLAALLRQAERDDDALMLADTVIDEMAALPLRRLLATYAEAIR